MITVPGQLAIKTVHGRYGDFNVGRLETSFGSFSVKNAELDQYPQGKYDGEFVIACIRTKPYQCSSGYMFETRAYLDGMTLSSAERLSATEARNLASQEPDPVEEDEKPLPVAAETSTENPQALAALSTGSPKDTLSSGIESAVPHIDGEHQADAALFGALWPLPMQIKLDCTVDRLRLREQCRRLRELGYKLDIRSQEWQQQAH